MVCTYFSHSFIRSKGLDMGMEAYQLFGRPRQEEDQRSKVKRIEAEEPHAGMID